MLAMTVRVRTWQMSIEFSDHYQYVGNVLYVNHFMSLEFRNIAEVS